MISDVNIPVKVLLVEDDEDDYLLIRELLSQTGAGKYKVEWAKTYSDAVTVAKGFQHDVYLLDHYPGEKTGLDLLQDMIEEGCKAPIIMLTGKEAYEVDVRAMKIGACDYLVKGQINAPVLDRSIRYAIERKRVEGVIKEANAAMQSACEELEKRVDERTAELVAANTRLNREVEERMRAEEKLRKAYNDIEQLRDRVEAENICLREEIGLETGFGNIVGESKTLKYVLFRVRQVAPTDSTVLILGETGTGKGLIAHAVHSMSPRKDKPWVTVNCAALPANLIESELFGREKGAFTGSDARQMGRFELADGGTIFLDEIGELPLELQAKLLRVVQDGEFERLGSPRTIKVDVRIITSTNRDLEEEVRQGRFREDLYYRLHIFPITVPPLRQRREDIPALVNHFTQRFARKMRKAITIIPRETMQTLQEYCWPGNVRELEAVIERAVIISTGPVLQVPGKIGPLAPTTPRNLSAQELADVEREHILRVLAETHWKIAGIGGAAVILGLKPSTLRNRLLKHGIKPPWKAKAS